MSGAKKKLSTSSAKREPMALPSWLPPSVEKQVRQIEDRNLPDEHRAILHRLATDDRMRFVWREFLRKQDSGQFKYPASQFQELHSQSLTGDEAQAKALAATLYFAFCAARDRMPVAKLDSLIEAKAKLVARAELLLDIADDLTASLAQPLASADAVTHGLADAAALHRVAAWLLSNAKQHIRDSSDPLTIRNERGDRAVRGVPIAIAAWLNETFGSRLDGTAATMGSVALGQQTSERATRSAFSGRKESPKKRFAKGKKSP
jgi:hypothetical protein